jgi:nucleotide-binding universal stress UspA family protein
MFTRVLVPLDGSRFAEAALPLAAAVSRASGASLELVSAYDPVPPPLPTGAEGAAMAVPVGPDPFGAVPVTAGEIGESLRDERTTYLRDAARRVREAADAEAEVALLDGRADRAILERVKSTGADLVVMATHGRGPMERAWLGSVADSLVRQLQVPVLLVRPVEGEREGAALAVPATVRRVVVTLDGSELAETVLEPAVRLAGALAVPVVLLRVVGTRGGIESTYLPHAAEATREHVRKERTEATGYLDGVARRLEGMGAEGVEQRVEEGSAARAILQAMDPDGADVVAMATHGRGGVRRLVLGSVSDKVVRAAVGPVLLVRPAEED